jgi:hypothetical protein
MKITGLTDKPAWSLGCALLGREDVVADEGEWAARLWAMADLATPMAVRVAATLRLADHVMGGGRTASERPRRRASMLMHWIACCGTWSPRACCVVTSRIGMC